MMKQLKSSNIYEKIAFAFCFLSIISFASSSWSFGYYSDNWFIEIYSNNYWHVESIPYTYSYEGWYYFDYPYRVYYNNSYYYFEPGWYSYNSYWKYNPWDMAYYDYYPGTYYYYGGHWYYQPDWIYTYGPLYYTTYYAPAYYEQVYYTYPIEGSGTGYTYSYPQTESCSDIKLSATGISIRAGSKEKVKVYIKNNGYYDLEINNVYVSTGSSDIKARNISYPDEVWAGYSDVIEFDLYADNDLRDDTIDAEITVSAQFKDMTVCNKDASFYIYAEGNRNVADSGSSSSIGISSGYATSYSYYIPKETSTWNEIDASESAGTVSTTVKGNNAFEGSYNYNRSGQTAVLRASTEDYSAYKPNESNISISVENLTIENGSEGQKYVSIRNYSREAFTIESIRAYASGNKISASLEDAPSKVGANSTAYAKLKVSAAYGEEDSIENVNIIMSGYFESGVEASKEKTVSVYVIGEKDILPEIKIPGKVLLDGSAAFSITVKNSGRKKAAVYLRGENAEVSIDSIEVDPKTTAERIVKVSGFESGKGYIFYSVYYEGSKVAEKVTYLEKAEANVPDIQSTQKRIEVVRYSSSIEITDGKAVAFIEVRNSGDSDYFYSVSLEADGFKADEVVAEIKKGETKVINIEVESMPATSDGNYSGYIKVRSGNEEVLRKVSITKVSINKKSESIIAGISALGMLFAGNSFFIGLLILLIIVALLVYGSKANARKQEPWQETNQQGF